MVRIIKKTTNDLQPKKTMTGISGFDEIAEGGLPKNRITILSGNTGSGKTVLSMQFLVKGAMNYNEPGVFMSFEEMDDELVTNMGSLHFNLAALVKNKKIYVEYLEIDRSQTIAAGKYNLEGLFVRLQNAIEKVGAKRIVLDSLDALFNGFDDSILRSEIGRLFKWLKEKKITAIITAEVENRIVGRNGLEQYIADCVIILDNRVINQTTTRRLRIAKMRGSVHGINEYPFIIDANGISVLPLLSQLADHKLSSNRITSGIPDLDGMLDGKGYYEGSSILISGSAGTGKTSIAVSLIYAACKKGIPALYCAFEESISQITRNMHSIGLRIEPFVKSGTLQVYSSRPTIQNLELHLISIQKIIKKFKPKIIVLDPITNLMSEGINSEIRLLLAHFVDFLKGRNITTLFTAAITLESIKSNPSDEGISAMVDTWILVQDTESNRERNRGIYVLKSRGMNHSTQVREFVIADDGISLLPIYISAGGILTGSAKLEHTLKQEEQDKLQKTKFESETLALRQAETAAELTDKTAKLNKIEISDLRNKVKSSDEKSKNRNK